VSEPNLREKAVPAVKGVTARDLDGSRAEIRLDGRQSASDTGVRCTPLREALCPRFARSVPRRASSVPRRTRGEVIETIAPWAALKGMAARLAGHTTTDDAQRMFTGFENDAVDERSEVTIIFHPYADDPPQNDRRNGPRRPLDPRSHEHHRSVKSARYQSRGGTGS